MRRKYNFFLEYNLKNYLSFSIIIAFIREYCSVRYVSLHLNTKEEWKKNIKKCSTSFVAEAPSKPVIYDSRGREVTGVAGPFLEGYDFLLTCQVSGGEYKQRISIM